MFYWKRHGSAAVGGIRYEKLPPEVTEKIYTALVTLGADPLPDSLPEEEDRDGRDCRILGWSLGEGHLNVTRAIAAAGVDILDLDDIDMYQDQTKCVQFLLTSGADVRSVTERDVHVAAHYGSFQALELLLDMGLEAFPEATEALSSVFRFSYIHPGDALPTIKVLIRGGADIVAAVPDMKAALELRLWDVVEFLLGAEELSSELGKKYGLIQGVLKGDQTRIREHIEAGEGIDEFDKAELRLAMVKGKEGIVKLLLECKLGLGLDVDDLLTTAQKNGNSKAVQTLSVAGADAALIPDEEHCHNADGEK
ncbi:hypothetical protein HK104_000667 [Borealophlyctis nickersoniae]|nr:hypothetical protein HK104_000667 [Borealophlyctis nickersoniae]